MRKLLQAALVVLGAAMAASGAEFLTRGAQTIPDKGVAGNTLDNEIRFHAALFLAYGAASVWCAKGVERKRGLVDLIALVLFLGGCGRLVSTLSVGPPLPQYRGYNVGELLLSGALVLVNHRVARASPGADTGAA